MRKMNKAAMAALAIMMSCSLVGVTVVAGQAEGMPGMDSSDASEAVSGIDSTDVVEGTPDGDNEGVADEETPDGEDQGVAEKETPDGEEQEASDEGTIDADNQGEVAEGMPGMDGQGVSSEGISGTDSPDVVADVPDTDNSNIAEDIPNTDSQGIEEIPDVNDLDKEEIESEVADVLSLQIPQRLGIVIDPWEMDGKGQIYSEQYTIRNTGEDAGILTLSFLCKRGESSTAIIRTEKAGLHDDENKSIYIEMVFGDTDRLVLSEEGLEYQAELEPGEELVVSFAGEVNEYASESWRNNDVEVEGIYSWNVIEDAGATVEAITDEAEETSDFEENDIDSIEGKPAVSGDNLQGNDLVEETDSSEEEVPANGNNGQDGEATDIADEAQDAEESKDSEVLNGNGSEDAENLQSETESEEPKGSEVLNGNGSEDADGLQSETESEEPKDSEVLNGNGVEDVDDLQSETEFEEPKDSEVPNENGTEDADDLQSEIKSEEPKDSEVLNGIGTEDADDLQSETESSGESDSLSGGDDGEATPEESKEFSATEDVKDEAEVNQKNGNDTLSMESDQDKAELETEELSEALPGEEKETPQQKTDDKDVTGIDSQETDQNPEIDNVEDGQEG